MEKEASKQEQAPVKAERLIYCGPSMPTRALQQYAVYKGGLPVHLDDLFKECPAIKTLFVPVANLRKIQTALGVIGSPEHIQYTEVLNFIKKGGGKLGV